MDSQVFTDSEGIINVVSVGQSTAEVAQAVYGQLEDFAKELRSRNMPVLVIVDISKVTGSDSGGRKASHNIVEKFDYDKMAIFGGNHVLKQVVNFILMTSRKSKVKYFDSRDSALAWLKS